MQHVRFMSDSTPMCEDPDRVGLEVVVGDFIEAGQKNCPLCSALLLASFNKGRNTPEFTGIYRTTYVDAPEMGLSRRQIVFGAMAFTSGAWIGFFAVLWWLLWR